MDVEETIEQRLASLTPAQRAAFEARLMERRMAAARALTIPRREDGGPAPLSYAQELLWLLSQVFDDGIAYNAPGAFHLEGRLDLDVLRQALEGLVDRHSILRTTYSLVDGVPMQMISEDRSVELNLVDIGHLPSDERAEKSQQILKEESRYRFDLVNGPVMRPTVIRLADDEHILMLNMHHIATDGYSRSAIYRDLTALYEAVEAGVPAGLEPLRIQYADYAVWHRRWLDGGVARTQLDYWTAKLRGAPSRLDLPTDFPRPPVRSWVGDNMSMMLDVATRESLRATARGVDATLFVGLLATFGLLLSRYSGQDDIVIGTPFAGRNRTELESMVGYFINPLALRLDLSGDPTFRELLQRVRQTTLEAFEHADVPYEDVVREVNPARDLSQTPVFQAMVVFHNPQWQTERPKFEPKGIRCAEISHEKGWSKFDLLLGMSERTTGLNTTWEYSTELFRPDTLRRMAEHFRALADSAGAGADRPLSRLSMLSDAERSTVLFSWNRHEEPLPLRESVQELFEEQVARTPGADAVSFRGETLSFDQVNRHANRIAALLREHGVGPGDFVGILMEKSLDLVPAVLGVVKSGAAYIPLDPLYPHDRIEFMISDASPRLLLTQQRHLQTAPTGDVPRVAVDAAGALDGYSEENPPRVSTGDDLAYVIYTSGSTGQPKGAMIANKSLASAHFAYERAYRLRELTAHAQMASFSFDVFTGDLVRSLLVGAKLVLCPLETVIDPAALYRLMIDEGIDAAEFVPATASMLFEWAEREGKTLEHMRLIVVSSEAWRTDHYEFFKRLCGPQTRLVNAYGLTEATIDSTWFEPEDDARLVPGRFVPIGSALDNTRVYVLNAALEPQPIGIPGELCVGGVAVARGYLHRPELTAQKFVPDPFDDAPGALLYRTGDLARWLPDGTIDFLGRTDRQIKIRGFRIEPGEVESVLESRPEIRAAAVVDRVDPHGERRLVAYVDVTGGDLDVVAVRDHLAEHVPNYMIPAAYAVVDELPLTPNGKVNYEALPEPAWEDAAVSHEFVAPRNETEQRLAEVWEDVVGVSRVGIHDDFFELGGHSLMAVRLFAEIDRRLGVRLPLSSLFETATIAGLAELVQRDEIEETAFTPLVKMRDGAPGERPLFLTAWAGGDVLPYRDLAESLDPRIPVYGLRPPGLDGRSAPLATIEALAAFYVNEMRRAQPKGPYRVGGFCFSGLIAYEMARLLRDEGETVSTLAMLDTYPWRAARKRGMVEFGRAQATKYKDASDGGRRIQWVKQRLRGLRGRAMRLVYVRTGPWLYSLLDARGLGRLACHGPWNPVLIASNLARRRYVARPLDVHVQFFRAQRSADGGPTPWPQFAHGGFDLWPVIAPDVTHVSMMQEPHVRMLAAALSRVILEGEGEDVSVLEPEVAATG
jgi:amino acid adenylation domain-containing protein